MVFDPTKVTYGELLRVFWEAHDPTQGMRQGNDVGTQYRSVVFSHSDAQREAAEESRDAYQRAGGYRPEFYYGQDWDLWYRLGVEGKFQMIEEVLYTLRVTAESISVDAHSAQAALSRLVPRSRWPRLFVTPPRPCCAGTAT